MTEHTLRITADRESVDHALDRKWAVLAVLQDTASDILVLNSPRMTEGFRVAAPDTGSIICDILLRLGVRPKLKGYGYLCDAIGLYAQNPEQSITKELYSVVAKRHNATPAQVERAIRTAIETAWAAGEPAGWQQYSYTCGTDRRVRPSNGEFVSILAGHLPAGS